MERTSKPRHWWLAVAAVNGAVAVAAGAFAVHGLKSQLAPDALQVFETGARYQMYHALALGLAAFAPASPGRTVSSWAFLAGIVLFSGSLYALAMTGVRGWGLVTPFGGVAFLLGWIALAWAAIRERR